MGFFIVYVSLVVLVFISQGVSLAWYLITSSRYLIALLATRSYLSIQGNFQKPGSRIAKVSITHRRPWRIYKRGPVPQLCCCSTNNQFICSLFTATINTQRIDRQISALPILYPTITTSLRIISHTFHCLQLVDIITNISIGDQSSWNCLLFCYLPTYYPPPVVQQTQQHHGISYNLESRSHLPSPASLLQGPYTSSTLITMRGLPTSTSRHCLPALSLCNISTPSNLFARVRSLFNFKYTHNNEHYQQYQNVPVYPPDKPYRHVPTHAASSHILTTTTKRMRDIEEDIAEQVEMDTRLGIESRVGPIRHDGRGRVWTLVEVITASTKTAS